MKQQFPQHRASMLSDMGIHLRRVVFERDEDAPVAYTHQDDYYIFGLIEKGVGRGMVEFKEVTFTEGDVFIIHPRQVHRFISSTNVKGWMLFADSSFVGNEEKYVFDKFQLFGSTVKIEWQCVNELDQIACILASRINNVAGKLEKATVRRLAETFIGIVAEMVHKIRLQQVKHSRRNIEIVMQFINLLAEHIAENRSPSHYAQQLNISPVYLNEVVKKVTGMNVTSYIKNELVLQAKRLLVHTDLTVKEISNSLGIDDYAYFTRIFTRMVGMSPNAFRQRNLK